MKKNLILSLFPALIFVMLFTVHDAAATNYTISDQSSCQALGGLWDSNMQQCFIVNKFLLAHGDTLEIDVFTVFLGNFDNHGTVNLVSNTADFAGPFTNYNNGEVVNTSAGGGSTDFEQLTNYGTITNAANTFMNFAFGSMYSNGTINNSGKLFLGGWLFSMENWGTITNNGQMTLLLGAILKNPGLIINNPSSTITIQNSGGLYNFHQVDNYGNFDNSGLILNQITFNNICNGVVNFNPVQGAPPTFTPCSPIQLVPFPYSAIINIPNKIPLYGSDPSGAPLTFMVVQNPMHGTVDIQNGIGGGQAFAIYTPNAGYRGPDSFTFDATDGSQTSNAVKVSITVGPSFIKQTVGPGMIIIEKDSVGGDGKFNFAALTTLSGIPSTFSISTVSGNGTVTFGNLPAGGFVNMTESSVPSGFKLTKLSCSNIQGNNSFYINPLHNVGILLDKHAFSIVKCKFENTKFGKIIIKKNTIGSDGSFTFTKTSGSSQSRFTITTTGGTGSHTIANVTPGMANIIKEIIPSGWALNGATCDNGNDPQVRITVNGGQTVTCTFTDTKSGG